MKSNRPGMRLAGNYGCYNTLLFACCLLFLPGCKPKPHSVNLTWDAPVHSPVPIVGYNVYRSSEGDYSYHLLNLAPVTETKYVDTVLQNGRTYHYTIKSVDAEGTESNPSNVIDVTIPE